MPKVILYTEGLRVHEYDYGAIPFQDEYKRVLECHPGATVSAEPNKDIYVSYSFERGNVSKAQSERKNFIFYRRPNGFVYLSEPERGESLKDLFDRVCKEVPGRNVSLSTGGDYYVDDPNNIGSDVVNSPSHYTDGRIEVIDFIEDKKMSFHLGNVVKYVSRAGKKDKAKEVEDLEKAAWYLARAIELLKNPSSGYTGFKV